MLQLKETNKPNVIHTANYSFIRLLNVTEMWTYAEDHRSALIRYIRRRFTIFSALILISRIRFLDTKKYISWCEECISLYQEFDFFISRDNTHFLISKIRIPDIKKYNSWYQEILNKNYSWYQEMKFLISKKYFLISKDISWYQEFISRYQELISWYQEIAFLISRNAE